MANISTLMLATLATLTVAYPEFRARYRSDYKRVTDELWMPALYVLTCGPVFAIMITAFTVLISI